MTTNTEVYDEAEVAEIAERMERESGVLEIRAKVFQGTKEDAEKLIDPNKECEECGTLIPVERQRAKPNATYCIDCQQWYDEMDARKHRLSGNSTVVLFG